MSMDQKTILLRWHTPQIDLQIQSLERDSNPIENLATFFTEIDKLFLKSTRKCKEKWFFLAKIDMFNSKLH